MSKITYDDKIDLHVDSSIADINKVSASDMNEIKTAVNDNADDIGNISTLTTTDKTSVVNAVNELNEPEKWVAVGTEAPTDGRRVWFNKGKNFLKVADTSKTVNGITFTVNADGSIRATGTATADAYYTPNWLLPIIPGQYTLSGCPSGGSNTKYRMLLRTKDANWANLFTSSDTGAGITINVPSTAKYVLGEIVIYNGQQNVDLTFKPMLNQGTTALTYEPYAEQSIYVDNVQIFPIIDTGWIDISSNVNTSNFAVRSGDAIKARRIGNIVYFKGEIYCKTALTNHSGNIMVGIPIVFRPTAQFSRCGVKYDLGVPYNIFVATNGNITVSEGQNISVTPDYKGYQLTNLSGYIVD